jgi:hypothetical protein
MDALTPRETARLLVEDRPELAVELATVLSRRLPAGSARSDWLRALRDELEQVLLRPALKQRLRPAA